MAQKSIELILFRQITSYLNIPTFIIDANEKIVFCNAAAETLLGFQFSEAEEISLGDWSAIFSIQGSKGYIVDLRDSSIYLSFKNHRLTNEIYYIGDRNDNVKQVAVYTLPIINHLQHFDGVVVFFQEIS